MAEKKEVEPTTVKGAVVVPPQLAEKIIALFGEMPRKFSGVIDPIMQEFLHCAQADVTLTPPKETEKPKE